MNCDDDISHINGKLKWEEQGKTEKELDKIDWSEYLGDVGNDNTENVEEFKKKLVQTFFYDNSSRRTLTLHLIGRPNKLHRSLISF